MLRFWLDLGLDGFRLDAVPYLFERDGTNCENLPETHAYLKRVRAEIDANYPDRVLLAEANQWPADVVDYFGDGDECHMAFQFPVMPRLFMAIRREDATPIADIIEQTPPIPDNAQWGLFLRNHDELTLEMVSDEERDYMWTEYATDPRMKLNLGIRRRLAPLLDNGRDEIQLMTAILFSLPGAPVLYYGDEIGMGDNIYLGDRDGVRTPMQWTGDRNGGFSRADFAQLYLPPLMDPVYGYQAVNVEAQLRTPTSLLRWLHRFIALRKQHPVFALGTLRGAALGEPAHPGPHPPLRGRDRALRAQPLALGAGGRARPLARSRASCRRRCSAARASRGSASCRTCSRSPAAGFYWFQLVEDERMTSQRSTPARRAARGRDRSPSSASSGGSARSRARSRAADRRPRGAARRSAVARRRAARDPLRLRHARPLPAARRGDRRASRTGRRSSSSTGGRATRRAPTRRSRAS